MGPVLDGFLLASLAAVITFFLAIYLYHIMWIVLRGLRARKEWQQHYSDRRRGEEILLRRYRLVIPERLIISRKGGAADLRKVRIAVAPLLKERVEIYQQRCEEERLLVLKRRKVGTLVSEQEIQNADQARVAARRDLYELWDPLFSCGIYPHMQRDSPAHRILRAAEE